MFLIVVQHIAMEGHAQPKPLPFPFPLDLVSADPRIHHRGRRLIAVGVDGFPNGKTIQPAIHLPLLPSGREKRIGTISIVHEHQPLLPYRKALRQETCTQKQPATFHLTFRLHLEGLEAERGLQVGTFSILTELGILGERQLPIMAVELFIAICIEAMDNHQALKHRF